ncbi:MAG: cupin domain-containing protein [Candidatus Thorarchaeota archaeon]
MSGGHPQSITALPRVKTSVPGVRGWVSQGDTSQVVFFEIDAGVSIPAHSHCEQFGVIIEGELNLKIGDRVKTYRAGDSYHIPSGVIHSAEFRSFVRVIDFFADPHRYETE